MAKELIRRFNSPCYSPVFFEKKLDGVLNPFVNYSPLNSFIVKYSYLMPSVEKLTDKLTGAQVFSKLVFCNSCDQFYIADEHKLKPAKRTQIRLHEYLAIHLVSEIPQPPSSLSLTTSFLRLLTPWWCFTWMKSL